ncbi:MAG: histidine ammonia-lyase [Thermoplasmata archaeon]|uniref:Histidine ammonia-lyase n=1 Tax=Candidatus Sysuiplasma superficiale TaxID=2823368 RepID=A0A8J7YU19_9ARCH|nr:histidine ammonia-lyase [Candidatus Sysuiplasma superficiale]MBX8644497.1 histidine ammonia-lyase [Candidatus Sysuiplasma superficiale]MCL4346502.1 histidine ammonia-lyase [Candidatus Thermoplasmatota archaeon]
MKELTIDGNRLTIDLLVEVARNGRPVSLDARAVSAVKKSRAMLESLIESGKVVYGVNTGFGELCNEKVSAKEACRLQENLVRSTCSGTGDTMSQEETRALMLLRLNTLMRGYSGVRKDIVELLKDMLNRGVHPLIPSRGSVGASGDLAPLAHMASVMMGEGRAELGGRVYMGAKALKKAGLSPVELKEKEGLALINGTQFMTALGALAVYDIRRLFEQSLVIFAMSLEALRGKMDQFSLKAVELRPHRGMIYVARRINDICRGSRLAGGNSNTQDPYTLRCAPQVLAPLYEMVEYCERSITVEMNSTTDNPVLIPSENSVISAGNFHGQPIAVLLDALCIPLQAMVSFSERRTARLVDSKLSGLKSFLADRPGIESGYMIPQYTAAALVSENKVLSHPSSSDSIPTSANQEDFVSMGAYSAIKLRQMVDNAFTVIGIEGICAARALDMIGGASAPAVVSAHQKIRNSIKGYSGDRVFSGDIEKASRLLKEGKLL